MHKQIFAGAALALTIALGGCATAGTTTLASTDAVVTAPAPPAGPPYASNGLSGTPYRVFPGDSSKGSF